MAHHRILILLVDDDTERSQHVKSRLEDLDPEFLITHIPNPTDTIDEIKKTYYDPVLSRYQMKNLDGITLTRQIREFSNIPMRAHWKKDTMTA